MAKGNGPVAIVDIGSNSVRLVVYEAQNRVAATLQNEKFICAIGRDMVTSGRLHAEGCAAALVIPLLRTALAVHVGASPALNS